MTRVGIRCGSHTRRGHLSRREAKTLAIATMEIGLDEQGIQHIPAKLFHLAVIIGLAYCVGEGFRQDIEEQRILANVELKVFTWQGASAQSHDEGMLALALPERQHTCPQALTEPGLRLACEGFRYHASPPGNRCQGRSGPTRRQNELWRAHRTRMWP